MMSGLLICQMGRVGKVADVFAKPPYSAAQHAENAQFAHVTVR